MLYKKLKSLKGKLREWNREVFRWIDLKVSEKVETLNGMDKLLVDNFGGDAEAFLEL